MTLRLLIVSGPDVDQRLDLMGRLSDRFEIEAAGSDPAVGVRFARAGFPFHHYPMSRSPNPLADARSFLALIRLIRRVRPDIVHAFATKPSVWGRLAARLTGVPVIVGTLPGLGSLFATNDAKVRLTRWVYLRLQKLACVCSDLTIFQNEQDRAEFVARGLVAAGRSGVIFGSGIVTERFGPTQERRRSAAELRRGLGIRREAVVITMVSRIIRTKGVLEFARAASRMRDGQPERVFLLAGPDDRSSVDRLGGRELRELSACVEWLGERDDVATLLAASDIFVFPSYYREGVPRVLMEAAASGLPIVTTDTPGCRATVDEGRNGFLVSPGDVESLTEAVRRLTDDPELRRRFGEASRDLARDRFDLSIVASHTAAHYARLLEQVTARSDRDHR